MPPVQDAYGEETVIHTVQNSLLPRLMDKLKTGEWIASGFGYESGQPTELNPRLWQRLIINVISNSAHDSFPFIDNKSTTGSFHSLGFRLATSTAPKVELERVKTIVKLARLFEGLDKTLPPNASKKIFFHYALERLDEAVPAAWLKEALKKADLRPNRRRAGLKSN